MTELHSEDVAALVRDELALIADVIVREALTQRLIAPEYHLRDWDYGDAGERYPCWAVVKDPNSDTAIVYSVYGHGPRNPWGLVSLSRLWFGMDSGWFLRLEDAFVDSFMASTLPLWDLATPDGRVIASSLPLNEAFAQRDALDAGLPRPVHHVVYRSRPSAGIP